MTKPANPQATSHFLSTVLSQRGPYSLPYAEDTKWLIRQHLLTLISAYPSLDPKTATFTHNDGRSVHLLQADGTVPINFSGVTYNIPIIIWLLDSYPRHPPAVFLNPTPNMHIKRAHPHVNPSGVVSIPYLQNWIYPSSNLVDLSRELSLLFSREPPLYSQGPNPNPKPPSPQPSSSFGSSGGYQPLAAAAESRPMMLRPPYPAAASPYSAGGGRVTQTDDAAEVYKRNAINKIVENVHGDLVQLRKAREAEMEGLLAAQGVLKRREEEVNRGMKEMRDEMEALETQLQVVLMNTDVLEAWVKQNEGRAKENFDAEEAFECVDFLSKQMLDCAAADLAIEDVLFSLDKAVQEGAVPFDQYLRNVRLLSREQFFHRATAAKVRAAQMQAQVSSMAARVPHYAT